MTFYNYFFVNEDRFYLKGYNLCIKDEIIFFINKVLLGVGDILQFDLPYEGIIYINVKSQIAYEKN